MDRRAGTRGDTLIEVMFAFSIFALVAVGSLTIMNQGIATAQRSLEITLVRAQMDAQAETIRYIHQAYVAAYQTGGAAPTGTAAEWIKMTNKTPGVGNGANGASPYGVVDGINCPATTPGEHPFILNTHTARVEASVPQSVGPADGSLPPFSQVRYLGSAVQAAYGIWIEAVPSQASVNGTNFVDFHIRTCWTGAGTPKPMTLGTIVRLYEPR
jgi:type II secretory pathway pseudopilin PulG